MNMNTSICIDIDIERYISGGEPGTGLRETVKE